jgi:hypothetical protein
VDYLSPAEGFITEAQDVPTIELIKGSIVYAARVMRKSFEKLL